MDSNIELLENNRQKEYEKLQEAKAIFHEENVTDVLENHDVICEERDSKISIFEKKTREIKSYSKI